MAIASRARSKTRRFDMRPGMHTPRPVRGGALVLIVVVALFLFMYTGGSIPFLPQGGYDVRAVFHQAIDLKPIRTPVRVRGIDVGAVSEFHRIDGGRDVLVTMHIDSGQNLHLTDNASAQVYWRTLLGFQYYIQLDPGTGSSPLGNATIPLSRTGNQVEVDQVLSSLNAPSRAGIQQLFDQLAIGFGTGTQAGSAIDRLAPSATAFGPALGALTDSGGLSKLVVQANRLVGGLRSSTGQLADLTTRAAASFGATSAQQGSIASILQQGPQTLDDTRTTMIRLNRTLDVLDPVAEALRPGARALAPAAVKLDPALRQLVPLLDQARPTLVALRPAVQNLAGASRAGAPFLAALVPTLNQLNSSVIPQLQARDPSTNLRLYEAIGPTFATVSGSASMFDANGFVQRFHAVAGGAQSLGFIPCTFGQNPIANPQVNCNDFRTALGTLLGIVPTGKRASRTGGGR